MVPGARHGRSAARSCQPGNTMSSHPVGYFYPGILTFVIHPGIKVATVTNLAMIPMQKTFTAFQGPRRLVSGPAGEVALVIKRMAERPDEPIIIFEDATGRSIDFDLRGGDREVLARLAKLVPPPVEETPSPSEPRGRGRPKLGVVAREVTLLPRHWEWLRAQPGGASGALRQLGEAARRPAAHRWRCASGSSRRAAPTATRTAAVPHEMPPIISCRPSPATWPAS